MANLLSRLRGDRRALKRNGAIVSFPGGQFGVSGRYAAYTHGSDTIPHDFASYVDAVRACPPAFSAQNVRAKVLSEARFIWRNNSSSRTPGRTWGSSALGVLEAPWPNGTTGQLIGRMEWHAGLGGNAFVHRNRGKNRLRVLRPDWVALVLGSDLEPDDPAGALDAELLGYAYTNGGLRSGNKPFTILPEDMAHWAPIPGPDGWVGESWFTPAVREMQADGAVTDHKLAFFRNGATPNLVVSGIQAKDPAEFDQIVDMLESQHAGVHNSYRTFYLKSGADATVVGANLKDLDLKTVQGASETRIASLSQVPAAVLNISEGLQGSSLNAGNLAQSRRNFADTWAYPSWRDLCAALGSIIDEPADSDLWFDATDVPFLRQDEADAADIRQKDAQTIRTITDAGFDPDSAVLFVKSSDVGQLLGTHGGLFSVQLQPPGSGDDARFSVVLTAETLTRVADLYPGHRVVTVKPASDAKT